MSKKILRLALTSPEKVSSTLAREVLNNSKSKLVEIGPFTMLGQIDPDLSEVITVGTSGVGDSIDDLIRYISRKKTAYAKKRAAMIKEAPYQKEYPLTKKAELSRAANKNITARNVALAAALFPWSLAIAGGAYLLNKGNSDS